MRPYTYPIHDFIPMLLYENEAEYSKNILAQFFRIYEPAQCKMHLWKMFTTALHGTTDPQHIHPPVREMMDFTLQLMSIMNNLEEYYCMDGRKSENVIQGNEDQMENHAKDNKSHLYSSTPRIQLINSESVNGGLAQNSQTYPQDEKAASKEFIPHWVRNDHELLQIVSMICQSMDVEKIFLLGKYALTPKEAGEEYDLLVLVNNADHRPLDEFESLITNRSKDMAPVYASVFTIEKVNELLAEGNRFFSMCCKNDKLIYDTGIIPFDKATTTANEVIIKQFTEEYTLMIEKAQSFLNGANVYYQQQEYALCSFMLHQSVEHSLNALLVPMLQYRLKTHSLHKLFRYIRRFNTEIFQIFPRDTETEILLFQLLQKAYIHARYKNTFYITEEQSALLIKRAEKILQIVEMRQWTMDS